MFETLAEYEDYISDLSLETLLDIETNINKDRFPERYDLVLKYIEKKRDEPPGKLAEGKPENKQAEDPVNEIEKKGGCLKSFLLFSGSMMVLRGGCRVIFGPKTFWEILLDLGIVVFGMVIMYTGLELKKMVLEHPKIIYTLIITEVVGTLLIIAIKLEHIITIWDIGLALIGIGVSWLIFNSAINLRRDFIKFGEVPNEPLYEKTIRQKKKGNKYFIGIAIAIIVMGVIRIQLFPPTSIQKAYTLLLMKQPEAAMKEFEVFLRKNPNNSEALVGAGMCQTELKNFKKAMGYFETAIDNNSEDQMIYVQIVYIVNHIMNNHDRAISILEKAKKIKEENSIKLKYFNRIYLENLGWAYYKKNDGKKALEYFKKAEPLWKNTIETYREHHDIPLIHLYYGVFQKISKNKNEAINHFQKVKEKTENSMLINEADSELKELSKQ